ncbi:MAG: DUF5685 family protein [Oscillospiraceae bacterium]|jgi:hypothetical protein|nr:DUF5685 family protein [Oscillospiraceae bacterium]
MFGYLRPMQGELKVCELERFKACYCGLCHALGKKYGIAARFILSYELVFLAMLLWDSGDTPKIMRKRCIASPCRKKRYCAHNAALDGCAGYSVILSWWKLRDTIADEPFVKSVPHRILALFLARAYKKASRECGDFDANARKGLAELAACEAQDNASLDNSADKFARILGAAAPDSIPETARRPLLEMLYHLGRWIYIIDACDDYRDDIKAGRYNPVAMRYPPENGAFSGEGKERLKTTLTHSNNLLCSAFELLPENSWTGTLRNMIYLGMPDVCSRIFEGQKTKMKRNWHNI